ncbi:MAG: bifunctional glutamate N-acetyltransferase/amino-acid acetyltransferase ArgJ [Candidatus Omnitrophica bacterium]|nr:bifunctional glutamate N-acetyltransferase/amino-acid acetyltransferase ArgJ [Candidatus Omnitrophota bacterium]
MSIPKGFLLSGIHCGIKKKKLDLGLIYAQEPCKVIGLFTTNVNPAYSVTFCKKNINNSIKAILVNSGNANCYSHKSGLVDTEDIALKLAKKLGVKISNILFTSTGIIGKKLPKDKIIKSLGNLIKKLENNSGNFSKSILTTDSSAKIAEAGVGKASILGFAKGAGMICPNMATMLGFIITDVDMSQGSFKKIVKEAVEASFNSISVDGCMSTNDTVLVATSKKVVLKSKSQIKEFSQKLKKVCTELAKMIVKDGEGASKFVEIEIKGARSKLEAKQAGMSLANSPLFKSALYGANANWGRVISSLGQVGIKVGEDISIESTSLAKKEVKITIDLKKGKSKSIVYTCDLTPEYVRINAKYS